MHAGAMSDEMICGERVANEMYDWSVHLFTYLRRDLWSFWLVKCQVRAEKHVFFCSRSVDQTNAFANVLEPTEPVFRECR